jgi:hypothetical protein
MRSEQRQNARARLTARLDVIGHGLAREKDKADDISLAK